MSLTKAWVNKSRAFGLGHADVMITVDNLDIHMHPTHGDDPRTTISL